MKGSGTGRALSSATYAALEPNLCLALVTVMHEVMLAVKLPRSSNCGRATVRNP